MLIKLAQMYITLAPAIFAGILNMAWCKSDICLFLKKPIDGGKSMRDGRRILGDNKTWKGFVGMTVFGSVFFLLWGLFCFITEINNLNLIYTEHANTPLYSAFFGAATGFAYALFELPNSFLKRRFGIVPGKPAEGSSRFFFIFLDQADSIIGCVLAVCAVCPMTPLFFTLYILIGSATHIVLNMLLYFAHLRKNMF